MSNEANFSFFRYLSNYPNPPAVNPQPPINPSPSPIQQPIYVTNNTINNIFNAPSFISASFNPSPEEIVVNNVHNTANSQMRNLTNQIFAANPQQTFNARQMEPSENTIPSSVTETVKIVRCKRGRKPIDKSKFYCYFCGTRNTTEWRKGPYVSCEGSETKNTLCNSHGLAYARSRKLLGYNAAAELYPKLYEIKDIATVTKIPQSNEKSSSEQPPAKRTRTSGSYKTLNCNEPTNYETCNDNNVLNERRRSSQTAPSNFTISLEEQDGNALEQQDMEDAMFESFIAYPSSATSQTTPSTNKASLSFLVGQEDSSNEEFLNSYTTTTSSTNKASLSFLVGQEDSSNDESLAKKYVSRMNISFILNN